MNKKNLFPKTLPSLTEEQKKIKDDFMEHWLKVLRKNYNIVDNFNHKVVFKNKQKEFLTTLEIGAGIGEHLNYEDLTENQKKNYYALEKRENVISILKKEHPDINAVHGDAEKELPFDDNYFDRIIAIHVLEHLPNLPFTLEESSRVLKKTGLFQVVIPCEGSLAYSIARKISAERIFKKKYKMNYDWYIKSEHINKPNEIFKELSKFYKVKKKFYFPIPIPFEFCNLCIGVNLELKN
jgi:ubiquinone/menaquinone biosynthesis C-methylase UbiE